MFCLIKGFTKYAISNHGRIINTFTGYILKQTKDKDGYLTITLKNEQGKNVCLKAHRLVALHFIDNPNNKKTVDHKDNNRQNNMVTNLRFATRQENAINRKLAANNTTGFKGIRIKQNKYIAYITLNTKYTHLGTFEKLEDALQARFNKVNELFGEFCNDCERLTIA